MKKTTSQRKSIFRDRSAAPSVNQQYFMRRENPNNVFIQENDVISVLHKYGINISVGCLGHFQQAFVHRSYLKTDDPQQDIGGSVEEYRVPLQDTCNERLELLGDCILSSVIGTYLFTRFDEEGEGFLTKTKTKIVRGKTLGKLSRRMGFGKWVIISMHVENEGGRDNIRILEDLFECFIAALYLDNGGDPVTEEWFNGVSKLKQTRDELLALENRLLQSTSASDIANYIRLVQADRNLTDTVLAGRSNGYLICQKFIMSVVEREIDLVKLIRLNDNYKEQLQHYFQTNFHGIFPDWEVLKVEGPTNDRWHTVGVHDDRGSLIGTGVARKKIDAEQKASKQALQTLGVDVLSDSDDEEEYYMKSTIEN